MPAKLAICGLLVQLVHQGIGDRAGSVRSDRLVVVRAIRRADGWYLDVGVDLRHVGDGPLSNLRLQCPLLFAGFNLPQVVDAAFLL